MYYYLYILRGVCPMNHESTHSGTKVHQLLTTAYTVRPSGLLFFMPAYLLLYSFFSSFLPLFLRLISSLLFPCASVWETLLLEFPISYYIFLSLVQEKQNMPSGHYYRHWS